MEILFPTGRMIGGSLYKMQPRTDNAGKPKLNQGGTPSMQCSFGVAIPKVQGQHWSQTAWGQQILQVGAQAYPQQYQAPAFAWKIKDGDDRTPNKRGTILADSEYNRGNWIIWFSQGWQPKLVTSDGSQELTAEGAIKPGYFVRVLAEVMGNAPSPSPGVYINPKAVALMYEGEVIATEVDTRAFAAAPADPMPVGARPVQAAAPQFGAPAGGAAPFPQATAPAPQFGAPAGGAASFPQATAAPAPAFLHPPGAAPMATGAGIAPPPGVVAAPPAPVGRQMTAKANGIAYEQYIAQGWTDALLVQHGFMVG